jgi:hypothetical protein
MLRYHATGRWVPGSVRVSWTRGSRRTIPEVERLIERAWTEEKARLGDKLFDGPMCRMERWTATPDFLGLEFSHTSYRPFLGTNLHNPSLADVHGADILANPVGVSIALETGDGWLLLGRRNDSVAYYPDRVHPFAGALEPADDLDVFGEVRRELDEELSLHGDAISDIVCVGLVEDLRLRQPELIFSARGRPMRTEIEATLDRKEHHAVYAVRADAAEVANAIADPALTPVAVAALSLWGLARFGRDWFDARAPLA